MRLYLDQMLRADLAASLRADGYDVLRAEEVGQARADDAEILARARSEDRILVMLDHHFGDWAVLPLSLHPGVVRVRVNPATRQNIEVLLLPFLNGKTPEQFRNHLAIVSTHGERWIRTAADVD